MGTATMGTARTMYPVRLEPRKLVVSRDGRPVPALIWIPPGTREQLPLVLVGHDGNGHKRGPTVVAMAHGLAREHRIATLAIDGPASGERAANDADARALRREDRTSFRRRYYLDCYDSMVADWRAALDAAQQLPEIGRGPVGYWGLSMGTRFGVPLIVAEPRIRAAVIGLFGHLDGSDVSQRIYDDAGKVDIPILFLQQLADEVVPQRAYYELFKQIGTQNKRLHANPGGRHAVPMSELAASRSFLARRLDPELAVAPDA